MKRIKPNEISENLSEEQLEILAKMANEIPVSNEWIECSKKLNEDQKSLVYRKRGELREREEEERLLKMTEEEKMKEDKKWQLWYSDIDSNSFHGNMGQPETPEEFKRRYGVWPSGHEEE
ncbi:hypothetical protein [uncultured Tenacibaculum sp.]|uniref:hypothetical protein n=1 Tax=uncultured Tenacibaculum sp. TaxID=174713 RepID=UPI002604D1C2|nr:hypothetical protein [uncultured Tenacibaculum sp.]